MTRKKENGPSDWEIRCIGDFVDIKHGYAFKGDYFSEKPTNNILLTPGNVKIGGGFKSDKLKYTTEPCPKEYLLKSGDIIVTMTDLSKEGDTLGFSAKIPSSHNHENYLHNQRLGLLEFKKEDVSRDFIYWVLRTKKYNQYIVGTASGSTVKHTSPTRIKQYEFSVPRSREEQQQIASIPSSLDDKIELNNRMNTTLEQIAQALFHRWFVEFEFPDEKGRPYKSSGGKMIWCEELKKEMPKGWEVKTITDVCQIIDCLHTKKPERTDTGRILLQLRNIGDNYLVDLSDRYHVSDSDYEEWTKNIEVQEGDCIITNAGKVGAIAQIPYGMKHGIGRNFTAIRPKYISPTYLLYYLTSEYGADQIGCNTDTGTIFNSLNVRGIMRLKTIIPSRSISHQFEQSTRPIRKRMEYNSIETSNLIQIRDSLLPNLLTGRIKLN